MYTGEQGAHPGLETACPAASAGPGLVVVGWETSGNIGWCGTRAGNRLPLHTGGGQGLQARWFLEN